MIEAEILKALQTGAQAAVLSSTLATLPIKFIGITFEPPKDQAYLECVHVINNPDDQYWGNEQDHAGLFRMLLHWPIDGRGPYEAMRLAGSIASYFHKGQWLAGVQISDKAKLSSGIENPPEMLYVISLRYTAFTQ